jgi:formylglycine-generating enzyme required for sulfatase activity
MRTIIFFLLTALAGATLLATPRPQDNATDLALWNAIKDTTDPRLFEDYLKKFPEGTFALVARIRLADLGKPAASATTPAAPEPTPGALQRNKIDGLTYAWIPGGKFTIGCNPIEDLDVLTLQGRSYQDKKLNRRIGTCPDNAWPAVTVGKAQGFWIATTEVPVAAYNSHRTRAGEKTVGGKGPDHPVVHVYVGDAENFCKASGGRLPSEAEWEYAARGPKNQAVYGPLDDIAWHAGNCNCNDKQGGGLKGWLQGFGGQQYKDPLLGRPVGTKTPNGWGLHDMLGNVGEWTKDLYVKDYNHFWNRGVLQLGGGTPAVDEVFIEAKDLVTKSREPYYTVRGGDALRKATNVGASGQSRGIAAFERSAQHYSGGPNVGFRCVLPTLD